MNQSIQNMRVGAAIIKELKKTNGPVTDQELWQLLSNRMSVTREEVNAARRWLAETKRVVLAEGQGSATMLWGLPEETKK
jgi:hypothetical protein